MSKTIFIAKTSNISINDAGSIYPNCSVVRLEVVKILDGSRLWEERFPRHEDSILCPNVRYNGFQMVGRYEDTEVKIPPAGWGFLRFMEHCDGRASHEEALGNCWQDGNSDALRNGRRAANAALERLLGIPDLIASKGGEIFVV